MMVVIYTFMLMALGLAWFDPGRSAIFCWGSALLLATGWFLFHVYSPDVGFRIPWLQF